MNTEFLVEALPKEITRAKALFRTYLDKIPQNTVLLHLIKDDIAAAEHALLYRDTVAMIRSYHELMALK